MHSSRFLLSACAFLTGFVAGWTLVSEGIISIRSFAFVTPWELAAYWITIAILVAFWFHFFLRPRGGQFLVSSRPVLSLTSFLIGGATSIFLIDHSIIKATSVTAMPTHYLVGYAIVLISLAISWFAVFVDYRKDNLGK